MNIFEETDNKKINLIWVASCNNHKILIKIILTKKDNLKILIFRYLNILINT